MHQTSGDLIYIAHIRGDFSTCTHGIYSVLGLVLSLCSTMQLEVVAITIQADLRSSFPVVGSTDHGALAVFGRAARFCIIHSACN